VRDINGIGEPTRGRPAHYVPTLPRRLDTDVVVVDRISLLVAGGIRLADALPAAILVLGLNRARNWMWPAAERTAWRGRRRDLDRVDVHEILRTHHKT
jgi:hypothetical protein